MGKKTNVGSRGACASETERNGPKAGALSTTHAASPVSEPSSLLTAEAANWPKESVRSSKTGTEMWKASRRAPIATIAANELPPRSLNVLFRPVSLITASGARPILAATTRRTASLRLPLSHSFCASRIAVASWPARAEAANWRDSGGHVWIRGGKGDGGR